MNGGHDYKLAIKYLYGVFSSPALDPMAGCWSVRATVKASHRAHLIVTLLLAIAHRCERADNGTIMADTFAHTHTT